MERQRKRRAKRPQTNDAGPVGGLRGHAHDTSAATADARREHRIHLLFEISLILKGAHAVLELAGGVFLQLVSTATIAQILARLTRGELREDPGDLIARYLNQIGQQLTAGGREFGALYLLLHGAINLGLVAGLLMERLWAYPAALAMLGAFVGYQVYRYTQTQALGLVALTALDIIVILLVWHEYRLMRGRLGRRRE
jgi:uncharacterized membrane protein